MLSTFGLLACHYSDVPWNGKGRQETPLQFDVQNGAAGTFVGQWGIVSFSDVRADRHIAWAY